MYILEEMDRLYQAMGIFVKQCMYVLQFHNSQNNFSIRLVINDMCIISSNINLFFIIIFL